MTDASAAAGLPHANWASACNVSRISLARPKTVTVQPVYTRNSRQARAGRVARD